MKDLYLYMAYKKHKAFNFKVLTKFYVKHLILHENPK